MIFRRKKPPLTLHIGLGKTGTTALQKFFWSNRELLEQRGVVYPDYGVKAGAHHLLSPFATPDLTAIWDFIPAKEWAPELARKQRLHTLVSSELMVAAEADTVKAFCKEVSKHFTARILVYLRRQDNVLMASYNQNVKSGKQFRRLADVYQNMMRRFDYMAVLKPWVESLGPTNIIVRPYEAEQFYLQDIRYDFLYHAFGIKDVSEFTIQQGDPNPRLDAGTVEYKRMLNCIVEDPQKLERFRDLLSDFSLEPTLSSAADKPILSPAKRLEILQHYEQGNAELARTFLNKPDGNLFLEPVPDAAAPFEEHALTQDQSRAITDYLTTQDPTLMQWLAAKLPAYLDSERPAIRTAAKRLTAII